MTRLRALLALVPHGHLAQGAWTAGALRLAALPCTLLLQLGLARLLRPEAYGEFMYAYTWYVSVLTISALGLHEATVRFVSKYRRDGDYRTLEGFLRWSGHVTLLSASAAAVIGISVSYGLRARITPTLLVAMSLCWAALPFGSLSALAAARLRACERFGASLAPVRIVQPLLIVGASYFLVLSVGWPHSAPTAATGMLSAVMAVLAITWWLASRQFRPLRSAEGLSVRSGEWREATLHFLGLTVVPLLSRVDVIMLGVLATTRTAGIYATAVQLYVLAGFGFHTLDFVVAPRIASLHSQGRMEELQRLLAATSLTAFLAAVPIVVILVVAGGRVLAVFDPEFVVGYPALVVLAGGQLLSIACGPTGRTLTMTGQHRSALHLAGASAVVNVTLNLVLIPPYGMLGAAYALASTLVLRNVLGIILIRRSIRVDPTIFAALSAVR